MMTEEEAKTKWCPQARIIFDERGLASGNRRLDDKEQTVWPDARCIGSACMAWRWADPKNPHQEDRAEWGGYCGAFGKPE